MSKKKEDLLFHAERLFYQHGFHAIGLKQIVKEADVALMTLYNHFDSKEALILEVLKIREQKYFARLAADVQAGKGNIALRLAASHIRWLEAYQSNGCMMLRAREEFFSDPKNPIVLFVNNHKQALIDFFKKEGLENAQAMQLSLLFEGATSMAETLPLAEVKKEFYYCIERLFLD